MRRRFFTDKFEAKSAVLRGDTAEHLGRVLRAEPGQLYELSDGERVWLARIEKVSLSKRSGIRSNLYLVEEIEAAPACAANPTSDFGGEIRPIGMVVWKRRRNWALRRLFCWQRRAAIKLCWRLRASGVHAGTRFCRNQRNNRDGLRPPILRTGAEGMRGAGAHRPIHPKEAFDQAGAACKLVMSERRDAKLMRDGLSVYAEPSASLAIGPEGGWTDDELARRGRLDSLKCPWGKTFCARRRRYWRRWRFWVLHWAIEATNSRRKFDRRSIFLRLIFGASRRRQCNLECVAWACYK